MKKKNQEARIRRQIVTEKDFAEGAAADLPAELVLAADDPLHVRHRERSGRSEHRKSSHLSFEFGSKSKIKDKNPKQIEFEFQNFLFPFDS